MDGSGLELGVEVVGGLSDPEHTDDLGDSAVRGGGNPEDEPVLGHFGFVLEFPVHDVDQPGLLLFLVLTNGNV